jgi:hypothetical protein
LFVLIWIEHVGEGVGLEWKFEPGESLKDFSRGIG